jgi:hypothetical protein
LSQLSFALNYYFSGLDPFAFKLTNLAIHLVNTLLVFMLAQALFTAFLRRNTNPASLAQQPDFPAKAALIAAALWGIHPLNLTSVLYIVQRMTSLSALFGFAALFLYTQWRGAPPCKTRALNAAIGVPLCLLASLLSKESGALFLPLLLLIEIIVYRGLRHDGQPLMLGKWQYLRLTQIITLTGVALSITALPLVIPGLTFPNRDFNLVERILTEFRVLLYYLRLFFLPSLSELSLFHDDITISRGLLDPPTTLASLAALLAITWAGWRLRHKHPILLFAWLWFLISHALESTVINLEIAFEHRNYFATLGFAMLLPWFTCAASPKLRRPLRWALAIFVALLAIITLQRAIIWGNAFVHAAFEAEAHPLSPRARFQLGSRHEDLFYADKTNLDAARQALDIMRQATELPYSEPPSWVAVLQLSNILNEPLPPDFLETFKQRLREDPTYNVTSAALAALVDCQTDGACSHMPKVTQEVFEAALENPGHSKPRRASLYGKLAAYYLPVFQDLTLAEAALKEAIALDEKEPNYHILLAELYAAAGRLEEARQELATTRRLDIRHKFWQQIAAGEAALAKAEAMSQAPVAPPVATPRPAQPTLKKP